MPKSIEWKPRKTPHLKYSRNKKWLLEEVGSVCRECGSTTNIEFDHINPALKNNRRKSPILLTVEELQMEKDNLQPLCNSCHIKRTALQKKAAWNLFISLPLDEQNKLIKQIEGDS